MPDDTSAALQTLIKQVDTLTTTVAEQQKRTDGLFEHNARLLDQIKDDKRQTEASQNEKHGRLKTMVDPDYEKKMNAIGVVKQEDGTWRLAGGTSDHGDAIAITREEARNTKTYTEAKARAASLGVPFRIASGDTDSESRGTATSDIIQSKVFTFDDTENCIRYVRLDKNRSNIIARASAAEKEGLRLRTFRTLDDLPPHARTKFELMEKAHDADSYRPRLP